VLCKASPKTVRGAQKDIHVWETGPPKLRRAMTTKLFSQE